MNTKNSFILAFAIVVFLGVSLPVAFWLGRFTAPPQYVPGRTDTLTVHDTIIQVRGEVVVRRDTVLLPVIANNVNEIANNVNSPDSTAAVVRDSALVSIPIVQRTFEGQYYRAVVQGYEPELVGIDIFLPEPEPEKRKPRLGWGLGLQLGYGLTPAGFQPYIGIGGSWGIEF